MTLYHNLGLDKDISIGRDDVMTRLDALNLFYNLLTVKNRTGQVYLMTLGHTLTPAGEIDRVALINSTMKGPVVAVGDWQGELDFALDTATVYRNGKAASPTQVQPYDVVYWSNSLRTVWAYSDKVTGRYQAASPSPSSPSAVTVAGKAFSIETADAAYALSSLEGFQVGDTVTLLLGRNGAVAAAVSPEEISTALCGVVTAVTETGYTDPNGGKYTEKTVLLTATSGEQYTYQVARDATWASGDLVQVTLSGGEPQLSRLTAVSTSGTVSADGTALGKTPFAGDVEILDVGDGGQALRIYPQRLAGAVLESADVRYCRKNAAGEIDRLILKDFTGDLLSYGVLTSAEESETPSPIPGGLGTLTGMYVYDVGGTAYTYASQGKLYNVKEGPVVIQGSLRAPTRLKSLSAVSLASADTLTAVTAEGETLPVWENVTVYELVNGNYHISNLDRVAAGCRLTGYWDKPVTEGGCLRVIVARPQ